MFLTYNYLSRCKVEYSNKEVLKCLIIIKKSTNTKLVDECKVKLIIQLHQIFVKNIDNFYNLIKNIQKEPLHTKDDLVGECYTVLQKCIRDFQYRKGKYFFWYYNKSLTRAFIRIVERQYYKHMLVDFANEDYEDLKFITPSNQEQSLIGFYMDSYGLDKQEKRVLRSILNGEKLQDFLKNNKDISWNKYYSITASLKVKMEPLREELKTYTDAKITY